MKNIIRYIFFSAILLLFLFWLQRTIFIIFQYAYKSPLNFKDYFLSNVYSFRLDLAALCYILAIPLILLVLQTFFNSRYFKKTVWIYFILIAIIIGIIHISDIGLFKEWGTKINKKAITYLAFPDEALASTLSSPLLLLVVIFIFETFTFLYLYRKYVHKYFLFEINILQKIIIPITVLPLLFLGARGTWGQRPIAKSSAYFSTNQMVNQASSNSLWSFINVIATPELVDPETYNYMSKHQADQLVKELNYQVSDTIQRFFTISKPNIVLIMLESWSAEAIGIYGNPENVTPYFDSIAKNGMLFTNFYATGFRTEHGLASVISGFPSQPKTTIIRRFGKFEKLPGLAHELKKAGYHASYYSGGDNEFANTKAYLVSPDSKS